jgi:molybdopterin molybdotransferase
VEHAQVHPDSPGAGVEAIVSCVAAVGSERIPLAEAPGRVLAEEVRADRDSPACDVSAMDGYAVRLAEVRAGSLPVRADARIGCPPVDLPPGAAARIVTGAPLPRGTEAVIKREDVHELADRIEVSPEASARLRAGESFRRRGENVTSGALVLTPGGIIDGPRAGVLASLGVATPLVRRRVRVAVLVTGDELVRADERPEAWQLRDSNGPALGAMLAGMAFVSLGARRHAADDLDGTARAIAAAAAEADVLFMTGGVSMGNRDFVPAALAGLGARILFHKIPQRPGRPILAAMLPAAHGEIPVLALPGNPVSVLATARRMGIPVVRASAGVVPPVECPARVTLAPADDKRVDLWWHRPVRLTGSGAASLVPNMGSGDIMSVGASDGFVEIPPGASGAGPWDFYSWRP